MFKPTPLTCTCPTCLRTVNDEDYAQHLENEHSQKTIRSWMQEDD